MAVLSEGIRFSWFIRWRVEGPSRRGGEEEVQRVVVEGQKCPVGLPKIRLLSLNLDKTFSFYFNQHQF